MIQESKITDLFKKYINGNQQYQEDKTDTKIIWEDDSIKYIKKMKLAN